LKGEPLEPEHHIIVFQSENYLTPKTFMNLASSPKTPFRGFFDLCFLGGSKKQQMSNEILLTTQLYGGYIINHYKDPY